MDENALWEQLMDLEADMRQATSTARDLLRRGDLTPEQRATLEKIERHASDAAFEAGCLQPE